MHFKSQSLRDYIAEHYDTQKQFAAAVGVQTPQVTYWLNHGFVVIDYKLYRPIDAEFIIYEDVLYFRDDRKHDLRPRPVKPKPDRPKPIRPRRNRIGY